MAIEIGKIINNITSTPAYEKACKAINSAAISIGTKFEKSPVKDIYSKCFEPVGANNSFPVLAGLMVFLGVAPRFISAAKRNPDNKEATMDEIKEIAFRDVQTIVILLFLLKGLNAVIASIATKKTGVPMTNKPFEKLFDSSIKSFSAKVQDFISHPKEKLKTIGKNVLSAFNPMGGVWAKTNAEHIADYSNYNFDSMPKLLEKIEYDGGDKKKVFDKILDGTVEKYKSILNGNPKKGIAGIIEEIKATVNKDGTPIEFLRKEQVNAEATMQALQNLKEKGIEGIQNIEDKNIKQALTDYLSDKDNSMLKSAKALNGWLRTGALAFEIGYLGLGIPALNQLRLEKKYLREHKNDKTPEIAYNTALDSSLVGKNINAQQIKLYHNFIK